MMFGFNDLGVAVDGAEDEAIARKMAEEALEMAMEAGYDPSKKGGAPKYEMGDEEEELGA